MNLIDVNRSQENSYLVDWYDSNGGMREISEMLEMFWVHVWKYTKSFGYLSVCKLYLNRHERGNTAIDTLSANARGPSRSSLGEKESGQSSRMMMGPGSGDRDRQMIVEKVGKRKWELPVCSRWWEEVFGVRQRALAWTIGCWMLVAFIETEHTGSGTAWSHLAKQEKLWGEEKLGVAKTGQPLSPPIRWEVYNLNLSHLCFTGSGKAGSGQSEQLREDLRDGDPSWKGWGSCSLTRTVGEVDLSQAISQVPGNKQVRASHYDRSKTCAAVWWDTAREAFENGLRCLCGLGLHGEEGSRANRGLISSLLLTGTLPESKPVR